MSSKLSKRRATVRKPKICVAASCPPPPPPPPPPDWPPDEFIVQFSYSFMWEEGPVFRMWTDTAIRDEGGWHWIGGNTPLPAGAADWLVRPESHLADLEIDGWDELFWDYRAVKGDVPVIWNTPTLYVINTWTFLTEGILDAEAIFTF